MWDVSRPEGPAGFEAEALKVLTAWRSGRFELPDYYLILGPSPAGPAGPAAVDQGPDFYLGPLRTTRPQRVAVVAATEPAQQAVGVLQALGSLPYGPWWPGLDQVIEAARTFYLGQLTEGMPPRRATDEPHGQAPAEIHRNVTREAGAAGVGRVVFSARCRTRRVVAAAMRWARAACSPVPRVP